MSARPTSRGRWIAATAAVALALFVVSAGGLVDQPLTPEARALFYAPPPDLLRRDSGFALLAGFDASIDANPRAAGAEWIDAVRKASLRGESVPSRKAPPLRGSEDLLCRPDVADCIARFKANPAWADEFVRDNAVLLARYRTLLGENDVSDHGLRIPIDVAPWSFGKIAETQGVYLAQASLLVNRGDVDAAIEMLAADNRFQRRWMSQSGLLVGKMVAVRTLLRNILFANELAR